MELFSDLNELSTFMIYLTMTGAEELEPYLCIFCVKKIFFVKTSENYLRLINLI